MEFTAAYDEYVDKVYAFIYRRVSHKQTAEDLTSQTFIKAWENIEKFDSEKGAFSSWIFTIAKNNIIDHYRRAKETYDLDKVFDLQSDENVEMQTGLRHQLEQIRKYIEELSSDQKEIIIMRVWDDLSFKDIAAILNKSESSIKMTFYRAMEKLQTKFSIAVLILLISKGL
jgi:RNA polymerase sigma-70 factor (ECF subfamily)